MTINYRHLEYFWTIARAGGVLRASEQLHLTPQTLSGQMRVLEERVGHRLLRKAGRGVEPTEAGRLALQYAEEIFALGGELEEALRGNRDGTRATLVRVGFADAVPKAIAYHVVEPALKLQPAPRLICSEGKLPELLGQLALRRLDLVVSDVPLPAHLGVRAFSHLLGRSAAAFFAAPALLERHGLTARRARSRFPRLLGELPMLMPGPQSALRPRIEAWLRRQDLNPQVAAEFDDSALLKAFGREGGGVFTASAVLAAEIARQYQVVQLGAVDDVEEEFYGISAERRITHPAVAAITASARKDLFAP